MDLIGNNRNYCEIDPVLETAVLFPLYFLVQNLKLSFENLAAVIVVISSALIGFFKF